MQYGADDDGAVNVAKPIECNFRMALCDEFAHSIRILVHRSIALYADAILTAMETTAASPAESFATSAVTQNGGTNYHHPSAPTPTTTVNNFNGKASSHFDDTVAEGLDDEDDYGPETDVDTVDESSQIKNVFDSTSATKSNNFDKSIDHII